MKERRDTARGSKRPPTPEPDVASPSARVDGAARPNGDGAPGATATPTAQVGAIDWSRAIRAVSGLVGDGFFRRLVEELAGLLEAEYAIVGELATDAVDTIETVAVWSNGEPAAGFRYDLAGTPCESVITQRRPCIYTSGVQREFPSDTMLVEMGVDAYVGIPLRAVDGGVIGLVAVLRSRPITSRNTADVVIRAFADRASAELERRRTEREIERSRDLLRAVIEASSDAIFVRDVAGHYRLVNRAAESAIGLPASSILGRLATEIHSPESAALLDQRHRRVLETGETSFETDRGERAGETRVFESKQHPFRDARGEVAGVVGVSRDVTEERRIEAERSRLASVVEQASEAIFVTDLTGSIVYANPACSRITGYPTRELLGANPRIFRSAAQDVAFYAELWRTIVSGRVWHGEVVNRRRDGSRWVQEQSIGPVRDETGEITHFVSIGQDVTERRRAEEDRETLLRVSRVIAGTLDRAQLMQRVQEHVAAGLDADRVLTYYLDPGTRSFRLVSHHGVPEDLVADGLALAFPEDSPVAESVALERTLVAGIGYGQSWIPDQILSRFRIAHLVLAPLVVRGRALGALAATRDAGGGASPFDPSQIRLLQSIARQLAVGIEVAELVDAKRDEATAAGALANAGRELIGASGVIDVLDRLCRITNEVLGCDWSVAGLTKEAGDADPPFTAHGLSPEDWETLRLVRLSRREHPHLLSLLERETVIHLKVDDLPDSRMRAVSRTFGVRSTTNLAIRLGGRVVGTLHAVYLRPGEVHTALRERMARGLSEIASRALEQATVTEALAAANRVKADFVAAMSHELRTPLNVIIGYNDLLLDGEVGSLNEVQTDFVRQVASTSRQLLELITTTLDLSRLEARKVSVDLADVDVAELLEEIESETRGLRASQHLELAFEAAPDVPLLTTDRVKLKVVLSNLVGNAVKFTAKGGVRVTARAVEHDVEFTVSDTGIGISPDILPVIFEPFRQGDSASTRAYDGVGLGLHIVRRMLDLLGGSVTVESVVGHGSNFAVRVPRSNPGGTQAIGGGI